jgi:hypothetical protein
MAGLKITQKGTDVEQAADYQTVLDSRWPLVEFIDYKIDATLPVGGSLLAFTHNLGYPPGWEFYPQTGFDDFGFSGYADKTGIYASNTGTNQHLKGRLRLYLRDFRTNYKADTITISPALDSGEDQTGLKIVDNNENSVTMRSPDYDSYSLNTNAKAMSIHMSGTQAVDAITTFANINHDLGYLPTFIAWQLDPTAAFLSQIQAFSFASTTTLSFRGVQTALTGFVCYLILKDPLVVAF